MPTSIRIMLLGILLHLFAFQFALGCNVCGGGSTGNSLGLLNQFSKNYIGMQYSYLHLTSRHPSLFDGYPDEQGTQTYQSAQLWSRIQLTKRIQVQATIPIVWNKYQQDEESPKYNHGIGDASVLVHYSVPLPASSSARTQSLLVGAGLKAPTGVYHKDSLMSTGVPNVNTGSGSWDWLAQANYMLKTPVVGVFAEASVILTTFNNQDYKFGNRIQGTLAFFKELTRKQFVLIPQIGIKGEYGTTDNEWLGYRWTYTQTGGYMLFAMGGGQLLYRNSIGIKATYYPVLTQQYAKGVIQARNRFDLGVYLLF